jgi:hypothetical protein
VKWYPDKLTRGRPASVKWYPDKLGLTSSVLKLTSSVASGCAAGFGSFLHFCVTQVGRSGRYRVGIRFVPRFLRGAGDDGFGSFLNIRSRVPNGFGEAVTAAGGNRTAFRIGGVRAARLWAVDLSGRGWFGGGHSNKGFLGR